MSDLHDLILQEHSKTHTLFVAQVLKEKPELIAQVLEMISLEEEPVSRRAAWALRTLFDGNKALLKPYADEIILQLQRLKSPPILRAYLAIISKTDIHKKWHAFLIQYTSEIILNSHSEIAVKMFALEIFFQISKSQPELLYELEQMIDYIYPDGSRGIQNKCRNMTKWIEKVKATSK